MSGRVGRSGRWSALALLALAGVAGPVVWPLAPRPPEDVAGARLLPPLSRVWSVRLAPARVWIVTDLASEAGAWSARRAGRPVRLAEAVGDGARSRLHLLGTDALGRDLAARLLHGLRHSLLVGILGAAVALLVGCAVGISAGLAGGAWDILLTRFVDVFLALPRLLVFLVVATVLAPSLPLVVLVLGGLTWPGIARLVRSEVQALRTSDLVLAARAAGCSPVRVAVGHVLPRLAPVVTVATALRLADTVLLESSLSFLGLGGSAESLGSILASGRAHLAEGWWIVAWPALALALLVLSSRAAIGGLFRPVEPPSVS